MISLLPSKTETYTYLYSAEDVAERLALATTDRTLLQNQERVNPYVFAGWVKDDQFRISLKIQRPNSFIPIAKGLIEPTAAGCMVLVRYELFPSSKMFLTFWLLFALLAGTYLTFQFTKLLYGIISFGVVALLLWISWSNFRIQLQKTREAIAKVLG